MYDNQSRMDNQMNSRFDMIDKILYVITGCTARVISNMSTGDAFVLYGMEAFYSCHT